MKWIYVCYALLAGAVLPIQAGVNLRLRGSLGDPIWAATVSFGVGTLALLIYGFASRTPLPTLSMVSTAPAWAWIGGIFGAFFVFSSIVLAGELGASTMMAWLLAGQFMAGLILDHYGLISFDVHAVSLPRILGVALIVVGAILVNKY